MSWHCCWISIKLRGYKSEDSQAGDGLGVFSCLNTLSFVFWVRLVGKSKNVSLPLMLLRDKQNRQNFWTQLSLILPSWSYWFNISTDFYYQVVSAGQNPPVESFAKINCHFEIDLICINRLFFFRHFGCTYDTRAVVIHNQGSINLLHNIYMDRCA